MIEVEFASGSRMRITGAVSNTAEAAVVRKIIPPGSLHFTRSPCEIADEQGTFKTQEYPLSPLGTNVPP